MVTNVRRISVCGPSTTKNGKAKEDEKGKVASEEMKYRTGMYVSCRRQCSYSYILIKLC